MSSMVNEADNKFTWVIKDFSSLQYDNIYCDRFFIGGYKWFLISTRKRTDRFILGVLTFESLPLRSREHAKFSIKIVNQISQKSSILREAYCLLEQKAPLCFQEEILLTELHSKDVGFPVNNELQIIVELEVVQVIGESDASKGSQEAAQPMKKAKLNDYSTGSSDLHNKETRVRNETVDVNGFQVSTSQVASLRCIFEKHPDFALNVRSNSQHLKSTYMNVLLGLIETLCQLPEKLSDDDLDEASAAVSYLTQVGFKMDWLEEKLEVVKEKKMKVYTGKAQLQHMEEEFKIFNKKCLDLKDLLDKQHADVSAAKVAFSFDDVV